MYTEALENRLRIIYEESEYEILFNGRAYAIKEENGNGETTIYGKHGTMIVKLEEGEILPIIDKYTGDIIGYVLLDNKYIDEYKRSHKNRKMRVVEILEDDKEDGENKIIITQKRDKLEDKIEKLEVLTRDLIIEEAEIKISVHNNESPKLVIKYEGITYESIPDLRNFYWENRSFK